MQEVVEDKVTIDVLSSLAKTVAGSVTALTSQVDMIIFYCF